MRCKVTKPALQRLATEQHGILTRSELLQAGVGPRTVDRWIKTGRLIALHRGVIALGHLPPSPHARTMAAVLSHRRVIRLTWKRVTTRRKRRGRDSNPRYRGYRYNGFRDRPIQPLSHPSESDCGG
jgi:hypothetical protein